MSMQAQAAANPPQQKTMARMGMRRRSTTPPTTMPIRALVARPRVAEVEAVLTVKMHWVPLREQEDPESAITPEGGLREQTELAAYCEVQGSGTHTVLRTLLVVFVKPTQAQPPPTQDEHAEEDW